MMILMQIRALILRKDISIAYLDDNLVTKSSDKLSDNRIKSTP